MSRIMSRVLATGAAAAMTALVAFSTPAGAAEQRASHPAVQVTHDGGLDVSAQRRRGFRGGYRGYRGGFRGYRGGYRPRYGFGYQPYYGYRPYYRPYYYGGYYRPYYRPFPFPFFPFF
jgi:hypothetical protein